MSFPRTVVRQSLLYLSWLPPLIFFENHVCSIAVVDGISMRPTFNPDSNLLWRDWVLEDKLFLSRDKSAVAKGAGINAGAGSRDGFERGDIVVMRSPTLNRLVTKRIVGLPGDIIATRAHMASVPMTPAEAEDGDGRGGKVVSVPAGHVWVEGDEQFHSTDSNSYGPTPVNLIQSRVAYIVWPPSRIGRPANGGRDPRISKRRMRVDGNAADWMTT